MDSKCHNLESVKQEEQDLLFNQLKIIIGTYTSISHQYYDFFFFFAFLSFFFNVPRKRPGTIKTFIH